MLNEENERQTIIGEASLRLAVGTKEITVASLIAELAIMARNEFSEEKLTGIASARQWLNALRPRLSGGQQIPSLNIMHSYNDKPA